MTERFIDCEKWRKEFAGGVDNLVRTFDYKEKPEIMQYYPQYYHKTDKDGRPVYIEALGNVDIEAMRKITTDERMLQNLVVEYEKMVRLLRAFAASFYISIGCAELVHAASKSFDFVASTRPVFHH